MSGLEDIPLIGDVAGVAIHGAEAIGDAVTGDWEGAAEEAQSMAGSAIGVATDGISTAVEDVYDAAAPAFGLPDSHELGHEALQGIGEALGDGAYDLMYGSPQDEEASERGVQLPDADTSAPDSDPYGADVEYEGGGEDAGY